MPLNCGVGEDSWESPSNIRRSNQSVLKEISPEYSLEGLMLKLRLQYFGHLMWRTDSLEKTLILGKTEAGGEGDDRGWDSGMASPTQRTWVWISSGSGDGQGSLTCCSSWGHKESYTTQWLNWTEVEELFLLLNFSVVISAFFKNKKVNVKNYCLVLTELFGYWNYPTIASF